MSRPMHGLRAWILQRVSALYLGAFVLYLLMRFAFVGSGDYVAWRGWVAQPHVMVLAAVFFVMLLAHAWVGARDVILDYASNLVLRAGLLIMLALALLLCAAWVGRILMLAAIL